MAPPMARPREVVRWIPKDKGGGSCGRWISMSCWGKARRRVGPLSVRAVAPWSELWRVTLVIVPEGLRTARLAWPRPATSAMDSMMSLPESTLMMTILKNDSLGWATGREMILCLFLEPGGLPHGFLGSWVGRKRFSRGWFVLASGGGWWGALRRGGVNVVVPKECQSWVRGEGVLGEGNYKGIFIILTKRWIEWETNKEMKWWNVSRDVKSGRRRKK